MRYPQLPLAIYNGGCIILNMNKEMTIVEAGKKGGLKTKKIYGVDHYLRMQKLSMIAKKKKVLGSFTVGEALNPVTSKSIGEKLEQIELGQKS